MNMVPRIARKYMQKMMVVDSDSTMVAIYPPQEWVDELKHHAHSDIQGTLHTTLVYLGNKSLLEAEQAVILLRDTRVRVVMPNGVELPSVRQRIYDVLHKNRLLDDQTYGFIPHMTLEYHEGPDMPIDWEHVGALDLPTWWVDSIQVVRGNKLVGEINFE